VDEWDNTDTGPALNKDGLLWWEPPVIANEFKKDEFGVTGYSYKITTSAALSGVYYGNIAVSGVADGTPQCVITTSAAHNLGNNDIVTITGMDAVECNGTWAIETVTDTTFELDGSDFVTAWSAGGKVIREDSDVVSEHGDIGLDIVTVIPAQKPSRAFKFPLIYKNRTLLCGYTQGKEANRCDFSSANTTEVWNGADSSDDGTQSLYFGSSEPLSAGHQIYNRYGSRVITMLAMFKDKETYVLQGDSPENFTIEKVSSNIGCPAPFTLASAEIAYETEPNVRRNRLFWLSYDGPYSFDGQVLTPIKGVEKYFDPDNSDSLVLSQIKDSSGWYDVQKGEYNLLIPTGTATKNNTWLVYDVLKKKWFRKDTGLAEFPQIGFPVTASASGGNYIYGGIDTGFMMRLENGDSWADATPGKPIEQVVETGDFWPTNNIWDLTRIRKVKVMGKRISEEHEITVQHAADTDDSLGLSGIWMDDAGLWQDWEGGEWVSAALASMRMYMTDTINRIARNTVRDNLFGWSHRFEFSVSTDETTKGFQPLGWGIVYQKEDRHDE
jgi:hypothetical protein